jgi:hypothetical protein
LCNDHGSYIGLELQPEGEQGGHNSVELEGRGVSGVFIERPKDDVDVFIIKKGLSNSGWHDINKGIREGRARSVAHMVVSFLVCGNRGLIDGGIVVAIRLILIRRWVRCR